MLSDRSYMRSDYDRGSHSVLMWLLGILAGAFVLQNVVVRWEIFGRSSSVLDYLTLTTHGLRSGFLWTLLTYALLHGNLFHLLCNGLGLFFFGRELQLVLGQGRFLKLVIATALGGAVGWCAVHFRAGGAVIGASAIVSGLLTVFACLYPRRPITLMLFFIIPVSIQPIWMLIIWGGIDLMGLLFQEIPGRGSLYGLAHSAHLGGMAAGWIFYQAAIARSIGFTPGAAPAIEPPSWLKRRASRPAPSFTVNVGGASASSRTIPAAPRAARATSRDVLRAVVDRILDKINLHGFGALTEEEKRVLDEARQHINPR